MVPVEFAAKGRSSSALIDTYAIVDSGASQTVIPLELAEVLEIDPDRDLIKEEATTAGGDDVQFRYAPGVLASVLGRSFETEGIFMETPLPLLGQIDFFSQFKVSFDAKAGLYGQFTLTPY